MKIVGDPKFRPPSPSQGSGGAFSEQASSEATISPPVESAGKHSRDMRILVAEDDLTARTIISGVLKKWNYAPIVVQDGQAAWEVLQQEDSPQLVILDWVMPKLDGLEVIQRARSKFYNQPHYFILLTTRDEASDIFSGLEAGANDYVRKPFNQDELFARIRVGQRTLELQNRLFETQQIMFRQATYDTLTEVYNRRAILDQLSKKLSRVQRCTQTIQDENLCIGYFDIDHFKQINDIYGHQAGDDVIKAVTHTISAQLRAYDVLGRLGGDEFLLLAPGFGVEHKVMLFDRLCKAITQTKIRTTAGEITTTISIGAAIASPNQSADHLLAKADAAMYQAKKAGGGRVFWAESNRDG